MDFTNSTLNLKHLAWVLLLLFFSCAQAEEYVPGRHYEILDNPTITRNPSKVEVVEVFWFGCNHCYSLESYIQPWKRNLPNDVDFWKSHITWNTQAETHARLFYSAKALGIEEKAIPAAFTAIWREGRNLLGNSEVEYFFKGFGVEKERYLSVSNSFGVNNAVKQANNRMRQWAVTGVPTIIVNGKYKVSGTREIGTSKLLDVVDFLIEKERKFQPSSN
jgi:thiol:disulfide interchange protein DsbA